MGFDGLVVVSDPYLQRRFTQADLRVLQTQVFPPPPPSPRRQSSAPDLLRVGVYGFLMSASMRRCGTRRLTGGCGYGTSPPPSLASAAAVRSGAGTPRRRIARRSQAPAWASLTRSGPPCLRPSRAPTRSRIRTPASSSSSAFTPRCSCASRQPAAVAPAAPEESRAPRPPLLLPSSRRPQPRCCTPSASPRRRPTSATSTPTSPRIHS